MRCPGRHRAVPTTGSGGPCARSGSKIRLLIFGHERFKTKPRDQDRRILFSAGPRSKNLFKVISAISR
eukprot:scaffold10872_cov129-Isochrysis_galbana.AAC.3